MKWCHQPDFLKTPANEDDNITGLWKITALNAVHNALAMVFLKSSNTSLIIMENSSRCRRRWFAKFSYWRNQQVQNSWHGVCYEKF
jgi:hypothetical protein